MADCIFCKIIAGQAPADMLYQDEQACVFRDIHPAGPTHILITPRRHIASVNDLEETDEALMGHLFLIARLMAQREGIHQTGYRLIVNTGPHAGQVVFHIHMHLIGGQRIRYPMG